MIFASDEWRGNHQRNTRLARNELAGLLTRYQDASGERVVLVFDGRGETVEEPRAPGGIQVFYAGSGETADDVIERLVAQHAERHRITVATDDIAERTTVEAFGAQWIGSRGFLDRIARAERDFAETIRKLRRGSS